MKYLLLFLLPLLASCLSDEEQFPTSGANLKVGDRLPTLSVELSDGKTLTHQDFQGRVSVILLFTTSCGDCRRQLPEVEALYKEYSGSSDVLIVAISRAESIESVSRYWQTNDLTIPYSPQGDRAVYELFASQTVPRIYISDRDQVIQQIYTDSPLPYHTELSEKVERLILIANNRLAMAK